MTVKSGEATGNSAKLFSADTVFNPDKLIPEIALGVTPCAVAVPPVLPAEVIPLAVLAG